MGGTLDSTELATHHANRKTLLNVILPEMNAYLTDLIQTEDQYVTLQRYKYYTLSFEAQEFLLPLWKRESSLQDMLPKLETCRLLIVLYRNAGTQRLQLIPSIISNGRIFEARNNLTAINDLMKTTKTFENVGLRQRDQLFRKLHEISRMEKIMLGKRPVFYSNLGLSREKVQDFFVQLYYKVLNVLDEYNNSVKEAAYQHMELAEKYGQHLIDFLDEAEMDFAC